MNSSNQHALPIVQVMDSLGLNRGGLTRAAFERFSLLSADRESYLFTNSFQPDLEETFQTLQNDGVIPGHTRLRNFHLDLHTTTSITGKKTKLLGSTFKRTADTITREQFPTKSFTRYFKGGRFLGLQSWSAVGEWLSTEIHDAEKPWQLVAREVRLKADNVAMREYLDENQKPRYRIYLTTNRVPYAYTWVTPSGYEYRTVSPLASGKVRLFKDMKELNGVWLDQQLSKMPGAYLYADEPRTNYAFHGKTKNVRRFASIHADHRVSVSEPLPKGWVKDYLDRSDNIDKFIFFTQTQANLFIKDTSVDPAKIEVISHAIDSTTPEHRNPGSKSQSHFVSVGRLAHEKRIDHIIRAFSSVIKEIPDATLSIYGDGPARQDLEALAHELGILKNVAFRGHTAHPELAFREADCSLLTSKTEGFGLVLLESFAESTPVIAYRVPYGPMELIREGQNGYLVADGDINSLAKAMISFVRLPDANTLRSGAFKTIQEYSKPLWANKWVNRTLSAPSVAEEKP